MEFVIIKLNVNEYNAIVAGLSKLPYEVSAQVIANLSEQVNAQINPSPKEK